MRRILIDRARHQQTCKAGGGRHRLDLDGIEQALAQLEAEDPRNAELVKLRFFAGLTAAPPQSIIRDRDGQRQTVADLMQLVRVIEVGMDVSGDGLADLDPSRIYYLGQSLGGIYGTEFLAVEPSVHVGVLNVAGGLGGNNRLSPIFRAAVGTSLVARTPSLLNGPGVTTLDGVSVLGQRFDEIMPLRDGVPLVTRLADGTERVIQSPVINTVSGAMPIQEVIEHTEWVTQSGDPWHMHRTSAGPHSPGSRPSR